MARDFAQAFHADTSGESRTKRLAAALIPECGLMNSRRLWKKSVSANRKVTVPNDPGMLLSHCTSKRADFRIKTFAKILRHCSV